MPFPTLECRATPITETDADALLLALPPVAEDTTEEDTTLAKYPGLRAVLRSIGFTGKPGSFTRVHVPELTERPLAVVGMGTRADAQSVRDAIGVGLRTLTGVSSIAVAVPTHPELWRAAAEGATLGGYQFSGYKSEPGESRATHVVVHDLPETSDAEQHRVRAAASAVALVKDLVSTPAQLLGPAEFAERATAAVADLPITVEVFDEKALAEGGYGGILGVGQGSERPPRLVRLDYHPDNAAGHVALVGKGITFDTGGLSLKPPASMVGMKYDMTGAATVLAVIRALATIAAPVHVTAWLCVAENMPSGHAIRPGDVLTIKGGTTVEVLNTDAEGRLVLADGLVAASAEQPDLIIDVATLTGAISVALGTRHTGVMGEEASAGRYLQAANEVGELAWQLPLPEHMVADLDSPIADLQNAKIGDAAGGSLFAGLFLRHFVGRSSPAPDAAQIPWLHLDIAGTASHKGSGYGFTDKGPTGATVRSLIHFLEDGVV